MAKKVNKKTIWGLVVAQGLVAIIFGVLALFWPEMTASLLVIFFGLFVLVWGVVGLIGSLASIAYTGWWWLELLFSIVVIGLGVYLLRNPLLAAELFIVIIGITLLVRGVVDLIRGIFGQSKEVQTFRAFYVVAGLIGIFAGILVWAYPVATGLAFVWIVALYAILQGALMVSLGLTSTSTKN